MKRVHVIKVIRLLKHSNEISLNTLLLICKRYYIIIERVLQDFN